MGGLRHVGVFKVVCIVVGFHLVAISLAQAGEKSCVELSKDLKSMQKAQHQILSSFEQKTLGLANTFDVHADNLKKAMKKNGQVKNSDVRALNRSAEALRKHQEKESDLVARFEKASGLLLDQVQECLGKNSVITTAKSVADTSTKN